MERLGTLEDVMVRTCPLRRAVLTNQGFGGPSKRGMTLCDAKNDITLLWRCQRT
jgi:hypothetical protein